MYRKQLLEVILVDHLGASAYKTNSYNVKQEANPLTNFYK